MVLEGNTSEADLTLTSGLELNPGDPHSEAESSQVTCRPTKEEEKCGTGLVGIFFVTQ